MGQILRNRRALGFELLQLIFVIPDETFIGCLDEAIRKPADFGGNTLQGQLLLGAFGFEAA
ncbi:MAG: hypothetical protein JJ908_12585 [Rhizobiales bacterium]|nr:hypothetical protein [Hyphomicrobiales bacterium]MBO6699661.1 hypothetical protein [Hyphomicrobiales bacterium]MBO6737199.1 hypothetical protein [Hyphomicrobiales bacterium]MBO6911727.1 hypothetical protein [Hyphomicrobiales bacterium]MBO6954851.1 hypothetical protein [Hyphomicrobiales bacterium]